MTFIPGSIRGSDRSNPFPRKSRIVSTGVPCRSSSRTNVSPSRTTWTTPSTGGMLSVTPTAKFPASALSPSLAQRIDSGSRSNFSAMDQGVSPAWTVYCSTSSRPRSGMSVCNCARRMTPSPRVEGANGGRCAGSSKAGFVRGSARAAPFFAATRPTPHTMGAAATAVSENESRMRMMVGFATDDRRASGWDSRIRSDSGQDEQPHPDHTASQEQPDPLFVMQVPVRKPVERRAGRGGDQDDQERQDKDDVIQHQIAVAQQRGRLQRQQAEHAQVDSTAAGHRAQPDQEATDHHRRNRRLFGRLAGDLPDLSRRLNADAPVWKEEILDHPKAEQDGEQLAQARWKGLPGEDVQRLQQSNPQRQVCQEDGRDVNRTHAQEAGPDAADALLSGLEGRQERGDEE